MASLRDIRKRIRSVHSSQKITRAMKMVAASKLRRAQDAIMAARPYADALSTLLARVVARAQAQAEPDAVLHPLLQMREPIARTCLVVISSDRGSCGAFNTNLFRRAERFMGEGGGRTGAVQVVPVGRKAREYFKKRRGTDVHEGPDLIADPSFEGAQQLAESLIGGFAAGRYDSVLVLYNQFKSAMVQQVTLLDVLPVSPAAPAADGDAEGPSDCIYVPSQVELLETMLPRLVAVQLFRAVLESAAAEHGARMTAMDAATKNAQELAEGLTLQYNRARQAYITRELMDIVGGAEALAG